MSTSNNMNATPTGPLAGVRILDLTSVGLGPLATQILGDFGADIIKVESLDGDMVRPNGVSQNRGTGSIFLTINRNKRSIAIDLKNEKSLDVLRKLVSSVDVFVHNMRVAAIEGLGLGYEAIKAIKPDIIYCVATGFGQSGPHRSKPAFDDIIQSACGMVGLCEDNGKEVDYAPSLIADKTAGIVLVNAVLAALFSHQKTG